MIRRSLKTPAYACGKRGETCTHERKGAHGYHNETWTYVVTSDDGRAALSLRVGSGIYAPGTPDFSAIDLGKKPSGDDISLHLAYPTSREAVLAKEPSCPCEYVTAGFCHSPYSAVGPAREFVQAHFVRSNGYDQAEHFWRALEAFLVARVADYPDVSEQWTICTCCDGKGTVDKK